MNDVVAALIAWLLLVSMAVTLGLIVAAAAYLCEKFVRAAFKPGPMFRRRRP